MNSAPHFTAAITLLVLAAAHLQTTDGSSLAGNEDDEAFVEFIRFQKEYGKVYQNQQVRKEKFETFKRNLQAIRRHNSRTDVTFSMGVTQFADLSGDILNLFQIQKYGPLKI